MKRAALPLQNARGGGTIEAGYWKGALNVAAILVVEDDPQMNRILCAILSRNGYPCKGCKEPAEAFQLLYAEQFDLIISDVMMPGMDGFAFAERVREYNRLIPILFITALDDIDSKRRGFRAGIDDYMVKPVDMDEMLLRVEALLRRARIETENTLTVGSLKLVRDEMAVYLNGEELPILPREFQVLYRLFSHPKKIFTRSELLDEYWGLESETGLRTVDVYITKLRAKLAACKDVEIVTVHGFGYKAVVK